MNACDFWRSFAFYSSLSRSMINHDDETYHPLCEALEDRLWFESTIYEFRWGIYSTISHADTVTHRFSEKDCIIFRGHLSFLPRCCLVQLDVTVLGPCYWRDLRPPLCNHSSPWDSRCLMSEWRYLCSVLIQRSQHRIWQTCICTWAFGTVPTHSVDSAVYCLHTMKLLDSD